METFFTDEDVEDIALNHVTEIQDLEIKETKRVMKAYTRVRHELRDRLDKLYVKGADASFTAQRLRGVALQVDLALAEMQKELLSEMESSTKLSAEKGIDHLIREIEKWNKKFTGAVIPINLDAVVVATKTSNFLFNKREASMEKYSSILRGQFSRTLTDGIIGQQSIGDITAQMGQFFLGEEWRLHSIVRTELHNVYCMGKLNGMNELWDSGKGEIPDLRKTLFHPMNKRSVKDSHRLNANNPIVKIDEYFIENSTGKELKYMAPPNRPNDRAILIPYRQTWTN